MTEDSLSNEWIWKMDYCKERGLPPAQSWGWNMVEKEYNKLHGEETNKMSSDQECQEKPKYKKMFKINCTHEFETIEDRDYFFKEFPEACV